jgi:hypothetical protein
MELMQNLYVIRAFTAKKSVPSWKALAHDLKVFPSVKGRDVA